MVIRGAYSEHPMDGLRGRQEELLKLLRANGRLSVAQLVRALDAGAATIRRDLQHLSDRGLLVRTYGGAVLPSADGTPAGSSATHDLVWKQLIAAVAAELVQDGQTIVITSGTTTLELARCLADADRQLTVITNALDVVQVLLDRAGIELIVLGGVVRPHMHSLLGHLTEMSARELRADTLFMGIPALNREQGLMSEYTPEVLTDRALRTMARDVVLLADATKFDRIAPAFVFGLDEVSTIVTDSRARLDVLEAFRAAGPRVIVAGAGGDTSAGALEVDNQLSLADRSAALTVS